MALLAVVFSVVLATFASSPNADASVTVPGPPTGVKATPGNASTIITWSAPSSDGGSAITGYVATTSPGSKTCTTTGAKTCKVQRLTNGTTTWSDTTCPDGTKSNNDNGTCINDLAP